MGSFPSHLPASNQLSPDEEKNYLSKVYSQLRQADWQHRPAPQPALLCDWGLYVGGLNEASDAALMQDLDIRAIVNTASSMCIYTPRGAVPPSEMRLLHIDADDSDYPLLEKHFEAFEHFVSEAKANGWKTLVHCQAYLIHSEHLRLMEAIHLVVERRGLVLTNPSFVKQLVRLAHKEHLLD
ncbi:unnamed protein product [Cladocopium goreaui]|uniref:protein-tyrosine-phosphatase n=1 Tax=Cladocopium goreaui TaxID=2562237 RepID=A0A9P1G483_9DINO|nr:unnamed protein product [Cladocopium goreaui]